VPPQPQVLRPLAAERPAAVAANDDDAADADDLLRSIEEQLGQFERRAQASRAAKVVDDFDTSFSSNRAASEPAEEMQPRREVPARPVMEKPVAEKIARSVANAGRDGAAGSPVDRSDYRFRGPASASDRERDPFSREELRKQPDAAIPVSASRDAGQGASVAGRNVEREAVYTRGAPLEVRAAAEEFHREARAGLHAVEPRPTPAEQIEARLANVEAEISKEFGPRHADHQGAARRQEPAIEGVEHARVAAAPRDNAGRAASRSAAQKRGKSRRALMTAVSVIAVAAIGGAAAMYLRSSERAPSGPPPVIAAPEGAVKVEAPQEQAAEAGTVGEAVYNRVAGNASNAEEQVVEGAEEPREIARIILPSSPAEGEEAVRTVSEGEDAAASPAEQADADIGPRRVATYVVRPDGTVVTTAAAGGAAEPAVGPEQAIITQTEQIEPVRVPTVAIGDPSEAAAPVLRTEAAPSAAAEPDAAAEPEPEIVLPPAEVALAPAVEAPPAAPVDLLDNPPAEAAAAPPSPAPIATSGEGYLVQVSSQRSREQAEASFADMQRRYASVLGNLTGSVQEANLGEQGIYYRVRVGPWATRDEATSVCEALLGAGGTCFVTQ
jgi:hypothetical protein